jgi:hypothetical protein
MPIIQSLAGDERARLAASLAKFVNVSDTAIRLRRRLPNGLASGFPITKVCQLRVGAR